VPRGYEETRVWQTSNNEIAKDPSSETIASTATEAIEGGIIYGNSLRYCEEIVTKLKGKQGCR
jgi:hypothetical protein